ncbi:MAG: Bug family tripartite tricarboxylate transporter substrate binding protein [Burkholderiales bacterium]
MKTLLCVVLACAAGAAAAQSGKPAAGEFPQRVVRWVVPFAPGASNDIVARLVGQKLADRWGQQVVIDNRGGAGGIIGGEIVARATPDGYTLLMANPSSNAINFAMRAKSPYAQSDFDPVVLLGWSPIMIVTTASLPANNMKELVALAKAKPGQLSAGSSGPGGSSHLALELFKLRTGTDIVHVPYKGAAPVFTDMLGGQIQLMFTTSASAQSLIAAGKLKTLGVAGSKRLAIFPDVPSTTEQGLSRFDVPIWFGIAVPARTPQPIVTKINQDANAVLKLPEVRERFAQLGLEPQGGTPVQFAAFIKEDIARWTEVVKTGNIKSE